MQRSLVSRGKVGRGLDMDLLPSYAAGQELEMVDQGSQVLANPDVSKLHIGVQT